MKALRQSFAARDTISRRCVALVCLALFLVLELFASAPALHKLIHSDGGSTGHHCAITLFSQGNINTANTSAAIVACAAALLLSLPLLESASFSLFDYRLSLSRAPPAA
jgi:hypothetical protein